LIFFERKELFYEWKFSYGIFSFISYIIIFAREIKNIYVSD